MFDLNGKVAIVTGGASGIGAATVEVLKGAGATVIAWDLNEAPGVVGTDITSTASVEAAAAAALAEHGQVDILVNCAGIITANLPAQEVDADDFRRTYDVNVVGSFNTSKALYAALKASGAGAIVNVASQAALVSLPDQSAYSASKGAVAALTRSLAIDWAADNIRVNAVCPGFTLTPMAKQQMTPELDAAVSRRVPLGRMFEPEEIGQTIAYLASSWASAVTGVVMAVDGGWTAGEPALPMGGE
ncbi:SDR family NAD(P)-dependent oxidoreductase [Aeromicrobium stalagmiti]|uniref:SDR family NAD(P)-dependent oxidoreductase n=1 Tax=Aeromicrobium stalagmiti TaxID=2738988 RepID=UPI001569FB49|nr:SDR family oxidoreductase [Aeromicrobium stalagmiti]NRQ48847.1 SDR family oxidoreductase [Aeromicrobium stalagmiti]